MNWCNIKIVFQNVHAKILTKNKIYIFVWLDDRFINYICPKAVGIFEKEGIRRLQNKKLLNFHSCQDVLKYCLSTCRTFFKCSSYIFNWVLWTTSVSLHEFFFFVARLAITTKAIRLHENDRLNFLKALSSWQMYVFLIHRQSVLETFIHKKLHIFHWT